MLRSAFFLGAACFSSFGAAEFFEAQLAQLTSEVARLTTLLDCTQPATRGSSSLAWCCPAPPGHLAPSQLPARDSAVLRAAATPAASRIFLQTQATLDSSGRR